MDLRDFDIVLQSEIFGRQRIDGFSFDVEVLLLAQAMGFSTVEVPVCWTNSPTSRVRVLHDSFGMLCDLFRIRRLVNKTLHEYPYIGSERGQSRMVKGRKT